MTETFDDLIETPDLPDWEEPSYLQPVLFPVKDRVHKDAVVAGGVLRDAVLGGEPQDIDIFIPVYHGEPEMWHLYGDAVRMWGEPQASIKLDEQYRQWNARLLGIAQWEVPGCPVPVQLIFFDPDFIKIPSFVSTLMHDFDMGISEIVWDGNKTYHSDQFQQDVGNKIVTITNCPDSRNLERTMMRYLSFKDRYPEFTLDASLILKGEG